MLGRPIVIFCYTFFSCRIARRERILSIFQEVSNLAARMICFQRVSRDPQKALLRREHLLHFVDQFAQMDRLRQHLGVLGRV